MRLFFTGYSFMVFLVLLLILSQLRGLLSRRFDFLRLRYWKKQTNFAFLLNVVSFATVSIIFVNIYGFITDDVNYVRFPPGYRQPFIWEIRHPTSFMLFLSYPFMEYLGFDRPSLHVLFAGLGFVGSAVYFAAYTYGLDLRERAYRKNVRLAFLCLFCFPNFMAWGRFFGKDSLIFTAAALFIFAGRRLITKMQVDIGAILMATGSIYVIQMLRPHIAAALVTGLGSGLVFAQITRTVPAPKRGNELVRVVLPIAMVGIMVMFGSYALTRVTGVQNPTLLDARAEIIQTARMGSYGGSATELQKTLDENPSLVFSPVQIAQNIFNLYFAPLPWQISGGHQAIAFVSNMLLLLLILRRWRSIRLDSAWAWFMVFTVGYLTVILSFMTGNIGLAMRQKIIVLPFLFMLLLDRPDRKVGKNKGTRKHQGHPETAGRRDLYQGWVPGGTNVPYRR